MKTSTVEENYLKTIFKLSEKSNEAANTNAIAAELSTTAASVTDMIKRLSEKGLAEYERYKGVRLTIEGHRIAMQLVRKHRIWEVFLVEKLQFSWDEVHSIAEELEHIASEELVRRLDNFLGRPKFDPHGDPIPDETGNILYPQHIRLSDIEAGGKGVVTGVGEHSTPFLQYLERLGLTLGAKVVVLESYDYDGSIRLQINNASEQLITQKVAQNVLITI